MLAFMLLAMSNANATFIPPPGQDVGACIEFGTGSREMTPSGADRFSALLNETQPQVINDSFLLRILSDAAEDNELIEGRLKSLIAHIRKNRTGDASISTVMAGNTVVKSKTGQVLSARWCSPGQSIVFVSIGAGTLKQGETIAKKYARCLSHSLKCWLDCVDGKCSVEPRAYPEPR